MQMNNNYDISMGELSLQKAINYKSAKNLPRHHGEAAEFGLGVSMLDMWCVLETCLIIYETL